ncbi:MAG: helicase C-terminal domain-containing protein, partial [Chthoniobacterales bacterium]
VVAHVAAKPGNHLVFVPSFAYLGELAGRLEDAGLFVVEQESAMNEEARDAFLAHFAEAGKMVGVAVLGGVFSEGIDLPGDRVVGVTVIGIGLPRLCVERDILQQHFEATRGRGFDYAYRFPGMQRVLQAVGRLIRSETDEGVALLVDRRFREARTRVLLPKWWRVGVGE